MNEKETQKVVSIMFNILISMNVICAIASALFTPELTSGFIILLFIDMLLWIIAYNLVRIGFNPKHLKYLHKRQKVCK